RAYDSLQNENYTHLTINRATNFVDSHILRYGIRDYHFVHYLTEFLLKDDGSPGSPGSPTERFLEFILNAGHSAKTMADTVTDTLNKFASTN
ncbi:hypothetical protein ALC57_07211, partial [Trachymyrmex cornetzi]